MAVKLPKETGEPGTDLTGLEMQLSTCCHQLSTERQDSAEQMAVGPRAEAGVGLGRAVPKSLPRSCNSLWLRGRLDPGKGLQRNQHVIPGNIYPPKIAMPNLVLEPMHHLLVDPSTYTISQNGGLGPSLASLSPLRVTWRSSSLY
jgi:hypothetical protein